MKGKNLKKIKEKLFLIVFFSFYLYLCDAQMLNSKHGKLETIKMSYITKKLNLSDKEAQTFWVVYPQYLRDVSVIRHTCLDNRQICKLKLANLRKEYRPRFLTVLKTRDRVDETFVLEKSYREVLRNELKKRMLIDSIEKFSN